MIQLNSLLQYLHEVLLKEPMEDFCPNGLQVEGTKEIYSVATAVSANLETIERVVEEKYDALIVHHGIFWNKESPVIEKAKKKKLALLLQNDISLLAYHLPLDTHRSIGNNWKAALDLGWKNLRPFSWGVQGEVDAFTFDEFKQILEKYYQHEATAVFGGPSLIKKVGLISGGAHKSILEASQNGLDAFITGSFDEPTWHQAKEEKVHFFGLGHSATEKIGPKALAELIAKELKIKATFLDIFNPF